MPAGKAGTSLLEGLCRVLDHANRPACTTTNSVNTTDAREGRFRGIQRDLCSKIGSTLRRRR